MNESKAPVRLTFGASNQFSDAIESLALARFVSGDEPFFQMLEIEKLARAAAVLPIGSIRHQVDGTRWHKVLARGDGWTALVERWSRGSATVSVTASNEELLAKVVADIRSRAPVVEPKPEVLKVDFWFQDSSYGIRRRIEAPDWGSIASHYTAEVSERLTELMAMGAPGDAAGGRLLLWHGAPGTGKTTAIRALARSWDSWCRTLFIVDPERFFGSVRYLFNVILESGDDDGDGYDGDDDGGSQRWRLLVIEDADELVRADAKRESGQALSRLLNVADGFLGQGVNVLILITTNEPVGRLHPAVARAGRCLAEVEFRRLSGTETRALLGDDHPDAGRSLTLAEVFERRGDVRRVTTTATTDHGLYL